MTLPREERLKALGLWPVWKKRMADVPVVAQAPSPARNEKLVQGFHTRGYLPHMKGEGSIYFVTFRLADSLPKEVLERLSGLEDQVRNEQVDRYLDSGAGECHLQRNEIADVVRDTLLREADNSCRLHAWVIMPNHVHLLIEPLAGHALSDILQAIKSVSARRINDLLGRTGSLWQRESYDHLVRDEQEFERLREYVRLNPVRAGLVDVPEGFAYSSSATRQAGEGACATNAIPDMDWDTLRQAVLNCTRCDLHKTRSQGVFGVGDPRAEWLIVGEAPGAEEDRLGEPFVGQAGKLLDAMLAAIGLKRGENVYIANVLKSRPPRNRDPGTEEVAACLPYLERQIDLIRPRLILALGRFAAQSLLATDTAIGRLRGQLHSYRGVPLIVTYHPAYLLRNPADKAKVWEDLVLARETMEEGRRGARGEG